MNNLRKFIIGSLVVILGFNSSCKRGVSLSETDFKEMYSSNSDVPQPRFEVFHSNESETEVFFMFENRGLTYVTNSAKEKEMSQVRIAWEIHNDYDSKEIVDSSSFVMLDTIAVKGLKQLQGKFTLKLQQGFNYILKVSTTDLNNSQKTVSFIQIDKSDLTNRQFFKVILKQTETVLFRNYFYPDEKLQIIYGPDKSLTQLEGKYFNTIFPIASPPFSYSTPKPFDFDNHSKFETPVINGVAEFSANKPGIYHFGLNSENYRTGLTLFQYSKEFPEVNTPEELLSPLRFITSKKEFEKLSNYQNTKKAVDDFWLTTSPDPTKAKKLIKGYYNRVQNANYFFSSYKEGWKTDRGVIYIVFGPPSIVYRSMQGESWTYGEESNYRSLTFNFTMINNPFTNNDFTLERTTVYKNPWYRAVDSWRQGKVASLDY